jgi:hypothetical protein
MGTPSDDEHGVFVSTLVLKVLGVAEKIKSPASHGRIENRQNLWASNVVRIITEVGKTVCNDLLRGVRSDTACIEVSCERPVDLKKINVGMLKIIAGHGAQPLSLDPTRLFEISMIDRQGLTHLLEIRDAHGRISNKIMSPKIFETTFDTFLSKGALIRPGLKGRPTTS